jgi:hypothetical protein
MGDRAHGENSVPFLCDTHHPVSTCRLLALVPRVPVAHVHQKTGLRSGRKHRKMEGAHGILPCRVETITMTNATGRKVNTKYAVILQIYKNIQVMVSLGYRNMQFPNNFFKKVKFT